MIDGANLVIIFVLGFIGGWIGLIPLALFLPNNKLGEMLYWIACLAFAIVVAYQYSRPYVYPPMPIDDGTCYDRQGAHRC